jgi:O-antigen ligase
LIGGALGTAAFLAANGNRYDVPHSKLLRWIRFSTTDENTVWGTARSAIWKKCLLLFQKSSVGHKLFGYGFNNVGQALETIGEQQYENTWIQDAHNVLLNSLITSGIIGTLLWAVLLGVLLVCALKKIKYRETCLFVIIGIAVYLAQGIANGPQILTTPVFLTELGVFCSVVKSRDENGGGREENFQH